MKCSFASGAVRTALSFLYIALLASGCATGEKMQRCEAWATVTNLQTKTATL
jgi:hypothetical protein